MPNKAAQGLGRMDKNNMKLVEPSPILVSGDLNAVANLEFRVGELYGLLDRRNRQWHPHEKQPFDGYKPNGQKVRLYAPRKEHYGQSVPKHRDERVDLYDGQGRTSWQAPNVTFYQRPLQTVPRDHLTRW